MENKVEYTTASHLIDYWKEKAQQTLKGNLEKNISLKKLEENAQQDKAIA